MILPRKENQLNSDKHISTSIVLHEYEVYKDHPNPGNQYCQQQSPLSPIAKESRKKQGFGRRNGPCA